MSGPNNQSLSAVESEAGRNQTSSPRTDEYETLLAGMVGSGTENDPYIVTDASELQAIEQELDAFYELGNDIDASVTAQWNPIDSTFAFYTSDQQSYTLGFPPIVEDSETVEYSQSNTVLDPSAYSIDYTNGTLQLDDPLPDDENLYVTYDLENKGTPTGFKPIGGFSNKFTGTIDGAGYEVKNLFVNRQNTDKVGLVKYSGSGATITNFDMVRSEIRAKDQVGGFVGSGYGGTYDQIGFDGTVTGVNSAPSEGSVGGLVGDFRVGTVKNSRVSGTIQGNDQIGGLIGRVSVTSATINQVSIKNSYSTATVSGDNYVGGLLGIVQLALDFDGTFSVESSYAAGTVSGNSSVGGIVGRITEFTSGSASVRVSDCYWDTERTGANEAFGFTSVSDLTTQNLTGLTTADMRGSAAEQNMGQFDFTSTWDVATDPDNYPRLSWERGTFVSPSTTPGEILPDEQVSVVLEAGEVATLQLEKVWTDWDVTVGNISGVQIDTTPDDGKITIDWGDSVQYRTATTITLTPNKNVSPDPTYVGGTYKLDVRLNSQSDTTTVTFGINSS